MAANFDYEEEDVAKMAEMAETVYQTVSQEFYAWKETHVAQVFARLPHSATSSIAKQFCLPAAFFEPVPRPTHGDSNVMLVNTAAGYSSDGIAITKSESVPMTVHTDLLEKSKSFPPHPPYQYCTPASRSENARVYNNREAPFVPFPEDPTFPRSEYLSHFKDLQWKTDQRDPDEEAIQYESVRRLHITHRFTADLIDDVTAHLNFRRLRLSNESGLLWDVSQRDLPDVIWADGLPSSSKKLPPLPPYFSKEPLETCNLFEQMNRGLERFCPHLNCIQDNCHVHVDYDWEFSTPPIEPKQSVRTSRNLRTLAEAACGDECFLNIPGNAMEDDSADDVPLSEQSVLRSILKIEPDSLPCDLAVICRIPCWIAFVLRTQTIDDHQDVSKGRRRRRQNTNLNFSGKTPPPEPCVHPGVACSTARCECFKLNRYCERNCRCEDNCLRRWPGCNSTCKGNRNCSEPSSSETRPKKQTKKNTKQCKCRVEGRECDPEKCTVCGARNMDTRCTNVSVQLARFRRFEVKTSLYGLGAFAAETIRKGDLIGEYVGELAEEENMHHHEVVQKHSKLNYCFGIEELPTTVVDAQWLGNPTRFLNDPKPAPSANCVAYEVTVNGELRIVIKAVERIPKGTELTLSYGAKYWNQGSETRDEEEEN
ncbi:hypothetical protein C8R45DRAFT_978035 [Mycena sanguinolenta]|nr:hypothetical protein C8R45DRAFT_978035 [Mycena sanguinolenta]